MASRELELMKKVVEEWEEMLSDGTEGDPCGDSPTFVASLREFRDNLVTLDLSDATDSNDPEAVRAIERDLAIVDGWLGGDSVALTEEWVHEGRYPIEIRIGDYTIYHDYTGTLVVTTGVRPRTIGGDVRTVEVTHRGAHIRISP